MNDGQHVMHVIKDGLQIDCQIHFAPVQRSGCHPDADFLLLHQHETVTDELLHIELRDTDHFVTL